MNTTAYSVAVDTTISDTKFQEEFVVYFQLLTTIEAQLLAAYSEAAARPAAID
jgi:hypothetical protein